jgi:hypothetical protein
VLFWGHGSGFLCPAFLGGKTSYAFPSQRAMSFFPLLSSNYCQMGHLLTRMEFYVMVEFHLCFHLVTLKGVFAPLATLPAHFIYSGIY